MAIVQEASAVNSASGGTSISTPSFDSGSSEILIVSAGLWATGGQTVTGVTDNQGNTYTLLETGTPFFRNLRLYVCTSVTNSASLVITASFSGSPTASGIIAAGYSGVDGTTPYYNNASTTSNSQSITVNDAGDSIISGAFNSSDITAYGTGQVVVEQFGALSTLFGDVTEELNMSAGADTQSFTNAAWMWSLVLKSGAGDVTAPVLQSAVVENAAPSDIVLTYDETLDATSTPANGDFTNIAPSRTVTGVVVSGTTVTITVNTPFANGDVIDFDYTASTNPIQDLAGNDAANLTNQAVTNNIANPSGGDTLHIGRWTGGPSTGIPGTTFAAHSNKFGTTVRNDDSKYTWTDSTSTLTLPSSNLADGYLIFARVEFEGATNRFNPIIRLQQTSGTGDFINNSGAGYARNATNENASCGCWGFIHNPSAGAEFQFQWARDTDANATGILACSIEVISLWYDDCAGYQSTATAHPGGTTPTKLTGFSELFSAVGTNFSIASDTVTIANTTGKKYLILAGATGYSSVTARTQRWFGLTIDSVQANEFKTYYYLRNAANEIFGANLGGLIEVNGADVDIELYQYRGDGIANNQGGADIDSVTTAASNIKRLLIIELSDDTEVFQSTNTGGSSETILGNANLQIANTVDFNDATSFTKVDNDTVNVEQDMDALFFANLSGASSNVANTVRTEIRVQPNVNGVADSVVRHGNYTRHNQGTQDTFGFASNPMGYLELTSGDDLSLRGTTTGNSGPVDTNAGWTGFSVINLDSLVPAPPPAGGKKYFIIS